MIFSNSSFCSSSSSSSTTMMTPPPLLVLGDDDQQQQAAAAIIAASPSSMAVKTFRGNAKEEPPCDKYGYEDAAPDRKNKEPLLSFLNITRTTTTTTTTTTPTPSTTPSTTTTYQHHRRSSLKSTSSYGSDDSSSSNNKDPTADSACPLSPPPRNTTRRRASIQCGHREFQYMVPGQSTPVIRRMSITFKNEVRVKMVEPVGELSPNANKELWFQKEEYDVMRRNSLELVRRVEREEAALKKRNENLKIFGGGTTRSKNEKARRPEAQEGIVSKEEPAVSCSSGECCEEDEHESCLRGLERVRKIEGMRSKVDRMNAWDSVLDEQEIQRRRGKYDDEGLAYNYKVLTMQSSREAALRGQEDAQEVAHYQEQTRYSCRRFSM